MKNRSRSATVDGSGQGTSWQEYVCSFISLETLVFDKTEVKHSHRLNVVLVAAAISDDVEVTPVAPAYLSSHDSQGHNSRKKKKNSEFFRKLIRSGFIHLGLTKIP